MGDQEHYVFKLLFYLHKLIAKNWPADCCFISQEQTQVTTKSDSEDDAQSAEMADAYKATASIALNMNEPRDFTKSTQHLMAGR